MNVVSALFHDETSFEFPFRTVVSEPDQLKKGDLLILHGGEDISPSIYGQTPYYAAAEENPSWRDLKEMLLAERAMEMGIPILGICRGAQLMCSLLGGKLWQHVDNHGRSHTIIFEGKEYTTNSCHHQMMIPTPDMEILAYAPCQSPVKFGNSFEPVPCNEPEAEIVLKDKVLMIQGHPEWVSKNHDLYKLTVQLLKRIV